MASISPPNAPSASSPASKSPRLLSLDALRGFDMLWIVGGGAIVRAPGRDSDSALLRVLSGQLEHKDWAGFAFYDLIFPLFVFIVGVSLVWSLTRTLREEGRAKAVQRVLRRSALLFLLGIFYSGGLGAKWPDIRLLGVLQRIALAYCGAGLLFCFFKPRALVGICAGILAGYWALMSLTPIRDIRLEKSNLEKISATAGTTNVHALFLAATNRVTGRFEPGLNVANHFDFQFLPGKKYDTYWDPEGVLSTLPAVASCLLGVFAGLLLRSADFCDKWKLIYLFSLGLAGVLLGFLWGTQFPVVKKIWTSSFVLVAGGYSAMLLAAFYLVIEVWKIRRWCAPFVWIGLNPITIYVMGNLLGGYGKVATRFVGGDLKQIFDTSVAHGSGDLLVAAAGLLIAVLFARFLDRRQIYLRL
jgi:predicted acyltransferase